MWNEMSYNRTEPKKTSRIRFEQHSITEKKDFYISLAENYSDEYNPFLEFEKDIRNVRIFTK
mgnify:CR=1 FL=1